MRAVVASAPLLDMRRHHTLLAGASWIAEYGDPDEEADWAYLREFSPYHNVRPGQPYPPVLLIASTRDDRVHPAHARKMTTLLHEHGYAVSYYENVEGGHGNAADNEQSAFGARQEHVGHAAVLQLGQVPGPVFGNPPRRCRPYHSEIACLARRARIWVVVQPARRVKSRTTSII